MQITQPTSSQTVASDTSWLEWTSSGPQLRRINPLSRSICTDLSPSFTGAINSADIEVLELVTAGRESEKLTQRAPPARAVAIGLSAESPEYRSVGVCQTSEGVTTRSRGKAEGVSRVLGVMGESRGSWIYVSSKLVGVSVENQVKL